MMFRLSLNSVALVVALLLTRQAAAQSDTQSDTRSDTPPADSSPTEASEGAAEPEAAAPKAGSSNERAEVLREEGPSDEAKKEAAERYKEGVKAYQQQHYKDAIDLFLEADQLAPSPALSFNIARAYDKILDTAGSLKYYRDYLRRVPDADDAEAVGKLVAEREQLLEKKGVQQVTVLTKPKGATIVVDDQPLGVTPWTGEIAPGTHRLELRLKGYADTERKFELEASRAMDITVRLVPAEAPPPTPPAGTPPPVEPMGGADAADERAQTNEGLGIWPWVTLGVGVATLATSGTFEFLRRKQEQKAEDATTQVQFMDHFDRMEKFKTTSRVLAGVGGGLVVASGVLFLLDMPSGDEPGVVAGCTSTGCAMQFSGEF